MRAATLDELARDPVGRFTTGETWAHFCAAPAFWGIVLWGRPTEEHAIALGRSLVLELAAPALPHASVIDVSRVEGVDAGAFAAAGRYLAKHRSVLKRQVLRVALVRPAGLGGAIVAGAYHVLPRPYPVEVFEDAVDAMSWLGATIDLGDSPLSSAGKLRDLHAAGSGMPALVAALRAHLESRLGSASVATAASALGLSERSLQRKLAASGTSFVDELAFARVRVAQRMMMDEGISITAIALEVGCASLQHFGTLFRRVVGESPGQWRKRALDEAG